MTAKRLVIRGSRQRVLGGVLGFFLFALLGAAPAWAEKESISIGVIAPLTGAQANFGQDLRHVAEILLPELSERSSRYEFKLILEDGQCGAGNSAVTAANKLISIDKAKFLIVACSGEVLQISPLAERSQTLVVGTAATHPDISKLGDYIFRTSPNIAGGVRTVIKAIDRAKHIRVGVLTEESAYTLGILGVMKEELGERITSSLSFPMNEGDVKPIVTKILSAKPDALYLNITAPSTFQAVVRALRDHKTTIPLYGYHQPAEPQNIAALGDLEDGIEFFDVELSPNPPEAYSRVVEEFRKKYPPGPITEWLARTAYDALFAITKGIETVGNDSTKVKNFLYSMDEEGSLGRLRFDKAGDIQSIPFALFMRAGGKISPVGASRS